MALMRPKASLYSAMGSIAEFEAFLARCAVVCQEHEKTRVQLDSLPDSEMKREFLEKFAESARLAKESEKVARGALNWERAKLN
jgi:hypothetical protein